nr:actin-related protein 6-like [Setaria viridis]
MAMLVFWLIKEEIAVRQQAVGPPAALIPHPRFSITAAGGAPCRPARRPAFVSDDPCRAVGTRGPLLNLNGSLGDSSTSKEAGLGDRRGIYNGSWIRRVVVIDDGGGLLKAGLGGDKDPIAVVPNCMAKPPVGNAKKWLVADQLQADDVDATGMTVKRPIDRDYLINTEVQREVWERVVRSSLQVDPNNSSLLLVEPMFNPPALQRATEELVFEEFGFNSLRVADAPSLVHLYEARRQPTHFRAQCSLVVECGFSFIHASPVLQNCTLNYGVRRIDLDGEALTNHLKELVSYRSLNVMDETLFSHPIFLLLYFFPSLYFIFLHSK